MPKQNVTTECQQLAITEKVKQLFFLRELDGYLKTLEEMQMAYFSSEYCSTDAGDRYDIIASTRDLKELLIASQNILKGEAA